MHSMRRRLVLLFLILVRAAPTFVEFTVVTGPEAADLGTFVLELNSTWAPLGTERLIELVEANFYNQARFFRVLPKFMAQFGMAADPKVHVAWTKRKLRDDPVMASNVRGTVSFAMSGPNTRTTQLFVNTVDNHRLDKEGFAPIGRVVRGMDTVGRINSKHKEVPNQGKIYNRGNAYLKEAFPDLSYVVSARVLAPSSGGGDGRTLVECQMRHQEVDPLNKPISRVRASSEVVLDVREDWAPHGAARFLDLVTSGALDRSTFYRAVPNFVAQFGVPRDAGMFTQWVGNSIPDDAPNDVPFLKGVLSFAASGPSARDCELFFSLEQLSFLGKAPWERVVAFVVEGATLLGAIHTGYGDMSPDFGNGPEQARVRSKNGYAYLDQEFPLLSSMDSCRVVSVHDNSTWAKTRRWVDKPKPQATAPDMLLEAATLAQEVRGLRSGGRPHFVDPLALLYLMAGGLVAFLIAVLIAVQKGNMQGNPIDRKR